MPPALSIRARIALAVGVVALAAWVLLAALSFAATGRLVELSSSRMFDAATRAADAALQNALRPVERATALLASSQLVRAGSLRERLELLPVLAQTLRELPTAAGIQLGTAAGEFFIVRRLEDEALLRRFDAPPGTEFVLDDLDGERLARYHFDASLELLRRDTQPPGDFDPRTRPWYRGALQSGGSFVTAPYVFFYLGEIGLTVAHVAAGGTVVATDIILRSVSETLAEQRITPSSEAVLHEDDAVIAWSGELAAVIENEDGSLRQRALDELRNPVLAQIAGAGSPAGWLVHDAELQIAPGIDPELLIAVSERELLADFRKIRLRFLAATLLLLVLLVPLTWAFASRVAAPIRELHGAIARVGEGDFDFDLPPVRRGDEIGRLNLALGAMKSSLRDHVEKLAAATAARERLESELKIARRIQFDLLPGAGALKEDRGEVSLWARVIPAREVGGDLYDLLELPGGRLFLSVGDVSDKGVGAALFMSRAATLARLLAGRGGDPGALLTALNEQLAVDNEACMFITYFCAVLDPAAGRLSYACAGHNPPLLLHGGSARFLAPDSGPPLGVFEGAAFPRSEIAFGPGDRLLVYSDGITEAFDAAGEAFGEQRLLELASRAGADHEVSPLGERILAAVERFSGDAPQSDDITLLIVGRRAAG